MSKALGQFVSGRGLALTLGGLLQRESVSRFWISGVWHLCDNKHKIISCRLATNNKHSFLRLYKMPK